MTTSTHPFTAAMKECPYPTYDAWREQAPLVWSPEVNAWLVTAYAEAKAILEDHRTFSSTNSVFGGPELAHPEFPSMINRDEPDHRQLRAIVSKAFTPRTIDEAWEPRIREVAAELMDAAVARGDGQFDVVRDLAYPLPVKIIAEIIGIPPERFAQFKQWSNQIVAGIGRVPEHGYQSMQEAAAAAEQAMREREQALGTGEDADAAEEQGPMFAFFMEQIADRRANPRDDLVTRLVQAQVDGRHLDDGELIAFLVLLLVAGNETTTNLMNHAVRAMAMYPEEQQRLRDRRDQMGAFLEETLRWEAPIQGFYRRALRDVEVGGVAVKEGDALLVLFGAANRDAAKYACPADHETERFAGTTGTRDHLAFGVGIHTCLGANLARIEAGIAMNLVLDRFRSITPVEGFETQWFDTPFFRGPTSYVVNVEYA